MNLKRACVFGASGGIGAAIVRALARESQIEAIYAGSRSALDIEGAQSFAFDLLDEASIIAAKKAIETDGPIDFGFVATGMLHTPDGQGPERSWRSLDFANMANSYAINTIGPALIAKHFLPILPRQGRAVFAFLSARVGSTSDNGLGGWHSYRASKAALNMLVRNFAIEMKARNPEAIIVAIHPGTVGTALSKPFQRNLIAGQLMTPHESAGHILAVLDTLTHTESGKHFGWDGLEIPA